MKLFVLVCLSLLFLLIIVVVIASKPQQQTTQIQTSPAKLTCNATTIDWGTLQRGETKTVVVILANIGEETTAPLNMTSTCMIGILTWDGEGKRINAPDDKVPATFTLKTFSNAIVGAFNFTIIITG